MTDKQRIIGVIPAHLASVRFPRKILHDFAGLPMIEHVRRRAKLVQGLDDVIVATCDDEIEAAITAFGGSVVRTGNHHRNGTSRASEAVIGMDCSHVVLLQGDEPLLLPRHIEALIVEMRARPEADAWNATGQIQSDEELDRHSFVKCSIGANGQILYCFRRSPSTASTEVQKSYIRKILGLFGFTRGSLLAVSSAQPSVVEQRESIEQMRIIEMGGLLLSVPVDISLPSVNEPHEAAIVEERLITDPEQKALLAEIGVR
ncbi:cytidylyltransferase domain-containing protein [Anianabacter salinae]|uniref:cytidylyltransferase domain-containing protein n=1 Tax=Anianabacter salinae TaxID=2851023 RepID=UPI00225E0A74|nr:NTP transferase domain-containing protein [Anianabacter salinae]MBV0914183.1 NTP transferase domain-containing protein [Anianabacter salinae]